MSLGLAARMSFLADMASVSHLSLSNPKTMDVFVLASALAETLGDNSPVPELSSPGHYGPEATLRRRLKALVASLVAWCQTQASWGEFKGRVTPG